MRRVLLLLLPLALAACSGAHDVGGSRQADLDAEAAAIDARRGELRRVDGELRMGRPARWSAYLDGEAVVLIEEERGPRGAEQGRARFYFRAGSLFRYDAEPAEGAPSRIYFDRDGRELLGATAGAAQVRRRAEELRAAALAVAVAGPPPQYVCRGNEPFWRLDIDGTRLAYGTPELGGERQAFEGRYRTETSGDLVWEGVRVSGEARMRVSIREERCADTMSDEAFTHRAHVTLPDGRRVQGCCYTGSRPPPARRGTDLTALPVADLAGKPPDDWSRHLLQLLPAIETCLARTPGSAPHVTKAWPMSRGRVGVRTGNGEGGWFECVARSDGTEVDRFRALEAGAERLPGEHRVVFSPAPQYPLPGECWSHERVERDGVLLGWLSTDTC